MANTLVSQNSSYSEIEKISITALSLQTSTVNIAPTFSIGSGRVSHAVNDSSYPYRSDRANGMALQTDGKIILTGSSAADYLSGMANNDFALVRYNSDGTFDTSFGGDGKVVTGFDDGDENAKSVKLQPDGKILMSGISYSFTENRNSAVIFRFNADGLLDTEFGQGGRVVNSGLGTTYFNAVTVQTDGKILLGGIKDWDFAITRYNVDGTVDSAFGNAGVATVSISLADFAKSIIVQTDGKILLGGTSSTYAQSDFSLARYNSDGSLDSAFGTDGKVLTSIYDFAQGGSLSVQTDGKILLGGYNSTSGFVLLRYNANGSLDTSFDEDGMVTTSFWNDSHYANSVTVQTDGKILLAGSTYACNSEFALVRYNSDGSLDTSFDGDGKLTTDVVTGRSDYAASVIVQTDGKILLGGTSIYAGLLGDFALVRYNNDGSLDTTFSVANTLDGTPTFVGKGNAVVLDNNVYIHDVELKQANNYSGSTLTLSRASGPNTQDLFGGSGSLTFNGGNVKIDATTVGTYTNSAGSLVIKFNNNVTQDLVNAVAQQITYANARSTASGNVQINWRFNDGSGADNAVVTGSTTVTLQSAEVIVGISGNTNVGQTLTAFNYINDPDGNGPLKYQWLANNVIIRSANSETYKLTSADIGKTISVKVSHVDGAGNFNSFTSDSTEAVADLNNKPTGAVKIDGNVIQGATLTASNTIADLDGISTIGFTQEGGIWYQWKANGVAINDNKFNSDDNSTLVLSQDQVGKKITVEAMYFDNQGNFESVSSRATVNVANVNDFPTGGIEISDSTPQVGQTLTINSNIGDLDGLPTTIRYQWTADGAAIRGALSTSYTVRPSDLGKEIKVVATYVDLLGKAERVESNVTSKVTNNNPIAPINPPPTNIGYASSLLWADQLLNTSEASYPANDMNGNHTPHEQALMIGVQVWESSLI